MTTISTFQVNYTQFIDPAGQPVAEMPPECREPSVLLAIYRTMVLTRAFDAKAVALQRTGQLGTYASSLGQEAIGASVGAAMDEDDVLAPNYRDCGTQIARGVSLFELLLYWGGDERGSDFAGPRQDFPVCIPVGTQSCHAVGAAAAFKLRHEPHAAVCTLGDGATSKGDFYEALNLAGTWRLPVVFVVNNNQWAISVPRSAQTAAETLAQKAIAAGIPGEQVDGNDAVAVHHAVLNALERARDGHGACLIEAVSYRLCDHTTADDATRYRDDKEVGEQWAKDPIARLRKYLTHIGAWTKDDEERLISDCSTRIDAAVQQYLDTPPQPPESMFDFLYAALPEALVEQRGLAAEWGKRHG